MHQVKSALMQEPVSGGIREPHQEGFRRTPGNVAHEPENGPEEFRNLVADLIPSDRVASTRSLQSRPSLNQRPLPLGRQSNVDIVPIEFPVNELAIFE